MNKALQELHQALALIASSPRTKEPLKMVVSQRMYDECLKLYGLKGVENFVISKPMPHGRGVTVSKIIIDEAN